MKYIKLTLQYMYHNIWYVLLFAIVPSLLLGFLTNPASNMEFIRDFTNLHTFTEIFSTMSELNLKNFLIALPVFPILLVIFSAASGIISKHMRRGIFNFNKFFRSVNNNILYTLVVGFSLLLAFELVALLNASFATLWIRIFENGRVGLTLSIVTMCVTWVILLLFAAVSLLWLPTMSVTGLNPAKALSESFRSLKGNIWKVLIAIVLPLLIYFAICAPLSYFVVPGRHIIYTIVYMFMLPYALILMFSVYCEVNDIDREDLRVRAFRKKGIAHVDLAEDDGFDKPHNIENELPMITDVQAVDNIKVPDKPNHSQDVGHVEGEIDEQAILNNSTDSSENAEINNSEETSVDKGDSADSNTKSIINNNSDANKTKSGAKKHKKDGGK